MDERHHITRKQTHQLLKQTMTEEFIKAVASNNLPTVRMMLSNELLLDPRGKSFAEMLEFAKDKLPNLFEAETASRFSIPANKEEWTDETLSKMKRDLNMNFSVEKLALFVEMAKYLGADKAKVLDNEEKIRKQRRREQTGRCGKENPSADGSSRRRSNRKTTGTIVTGSGAIIGITGLCIEGTLGTVLSIMGGAAVVCGVALLTVSNKTK